MKYKFNRRKINYVVKPEEKMVIGWIDTRDPDALSDIMHELKNRDSCTDAMQWLMFKHNIKDISEEENKFIKAVSKCDEKDEFDEKLGKKIVADIIEKKYHIHMMKKMERCYVASSNLTDDCFNAYDEHVDRLYELQNRIDSYKE